MEMLFDISQDELPIFLAEVDEHLQVLDEILVQLERDDNPDLVQKLFRAAHTLKGMAGMIGHHRMTHLTHALENAFDGVRKNTLQISTPMIDLCLDSVDNLRLLREEVVTGIQANLEVEDLVAGLQALVAESKPVVKEVPKSQPAPAARTTQREVKLVEPKLEAAGETTVTVQPVQPESEQASAAAPGVEETAVPVQAAGAKAVAARIEKNSIASAARAFQLMMALQECGEILEMVPALEEIESARPVFDFRASVASSCDAEAIWQKLRLISEVEWVEIDGRRMGEAEPVTNTEARPVPAVPLQAAPLPARPAEKPAPLSQPAAARAVERADNRRSADMTVRTTVERLDALMNLVGELITDRNHLYQLRNKFEKVSELGASADQLAETVGHLGRITDQLQEEVMRIRMLPIGNIFHKFPRMVRDMAQKTGKQIELVIHGEDTELDRSMIEEINDPLIHLVRNSVDHGIETPDEREAAGKPRQGVITMTARYEQGRIVLTVEDDGRGIDPVKIRRAAVSKGLISEDEANSMSDEQAVDLIFLPGLSTASKVSDISGRGVGMDIVHTNIQRVNGTIAVETKQGKGSVFTIVLPLTLAIVPTLLVNVGKGVFAIPLVMVTETRHISKKEIKSIGGKPVTILRGQVLPLVHLSEVFNFGQTQTHKGLYYAVVVHSGKHKVGLMVDSLNGQEEVVVKSLGTIVGDLQGISSAAILGDGKVALIVDVPGLFKLAGIH